MNDEEKLWQCLPMGIWAKKKKHFNIFDDIVMWLQPNTTQHSQKRPMHMKKTVYMAARFHCIQNQKESFKVSCAIIKLKSRGIKRIQKWNYKIGTLQKYLLHDIYFTICYIFELTAVAIYYPVRFNFFFHFHFFTIFFSLKIQFVIFFSMENILL